MKKILKLCILLAVINSCNGFLTKTIVMKNERGQEIVLYGDIHVDNNDKIVDQFRDIGEVLRLIHPNSNTKILYEGSSTVWCQELEEFNDICTASRFLGKLEILLKKLLPNNSCNIDTRFFIKPLNLMGFILQAQNDIELRLFLNTPIFKVLLEANPLMLLISRWEEKYLELESKINFIEDKHTREALLKCLAKSKTSKKEMGMLSKLALEYFIKIKLPENESKAFQNSIPYIAINTASIFDVETVLYVLNNPHDKIIIFSGALHSEGIRGMLQELGFKVIYDQGSTTNLDKIASYDENHFFQEFKQIPKTDLLYMICKFEHHSLMPITSRNAYSWFKSCNIL